MARKGGKKSSKTVSPRLLEDRRWCSDRRLDDRREEDLPVEEDRRSGEERRDDDERRGGSDRRRANRRCQFRPEGGQPCDQLAIMRDPSNKEWRCMEHLDVIPDKD